VKNLYQFVCIIFLLSVLLPRAAQAAETTLNVTVGVGGTLKERQYGSARVVIHHSGEAKQCRLALRVKATKWGEAESVAAEDVSLPANSRKRIELPLYAEVGTTEVEATLWEGRQRLVSQTVQVNLVDFNDRLIGVLAPSSTGAELVRDELAAVPNPVSNATRRQRRLGDSLAHVAQISDWKDVPALLIGLKLLDALIVIGAPPRTLDADQQQSLKQWVLEGGRLIIAAGDDASALQQSFLASLLPGELTAETRSANPAPLQRICGDAPALNGAMPVAVIRSPLRPLLVDEAGTPLIVRQAWGRGQVVLFAFNPLREPFVSWEGRKAFWGTLLRWTLPPNRPLDDSYLMWRLREVVHQEKVVETPPRAKLLAPLLIYGVTLMLAGIYVARAAGRKEKGWLVLCGIAVAFSVGFFIFFRGAVRAHATLVGVALTDVASDSRTASTLLVMELFSPAQSNLDMTLHAPHARFRARQNDDSVTMVNHEFTPTATQLSGDVLALWDLKQIMAWTTTPIDGKFNLRTLKTDVLNQTQTFRFTNSDRYPLSFARLARSFARDTNMKSVPAGATIESTIRTDGMVRRPGFRSMPSLSQMPPVQSELEKRRQTAQWLSDIIVREWGWWAPMNVPRSTPYLLALTERPAVNVSLPGFRQEWYHFVRVTPSDVKPSSPASSYFFFGFGSHLSNAIWVRRSADATFESYGTLRVGQGEVVLEFAGFFDRLLMTTGDVENDADVTYSVYNWKTGNWTAWRPREGANSTSPALNEGHFHPMNEEQSLVRLKINVEGSAKSAVRLRAMQWKGREE
jgi:hypothetical protein